MLNIFWRKSISRPSHCCGNKISPQTTYSTVDVLEPLRNLPVFLQFLLALIIGKSCPGQTPFDFPPIVHLTWAFISIILGVGSSCLGIECAGLSIFLIPLGWIFTLHGARLLRLTLQHAAAHNAVFQHRYANFLLGEFSSILTWTTDFRTYKRRHLNTHHDPRKLLNPGDETYEFWLEDLRVQLGMKMQAAQLLIIRSLISPTFHSRRFLKRLKACFLSPYIARNVCALLFWGLILIIVALTGAWSYFLISWLIPMSVLFECCSVLRNIVEHRWPVPGDDRMTGTSRLADLPPHLSDDSSRLEGYLKWGNWWLRLVFIHLPSRLLVLPGDSPNHNKHHDAPGDKDWNKHIFKSAQNPDSSPENWGLLNAINDSLMTLSLQIPTDL